MIKEDSHVLMISSHSKQQPKALLKPILDVSLQPFKTHLPPDNKPKRYLVILILQDRTLECQWI